MKPEFEEKSFEQAINGEFLLRGTGLPCFICGEAYCHIRMTPFPSPAVDVWAPGQVLEGVLGFDAVIEVIGDDPYLAELLGCALPAGAEWKQFFGTPAGVGAAPHWASLFVQYKRSDYLVRRRKKFLHLFGGPYYRFDIESAQDEILLGLKSKAAGEALVRYAAPRFHLGTQLYSHRRDRSVLANTVFIEPKGVEPGDDPHRYGAFDDSKAVLCSEPIEVQFESGLSVLGGLREVGGDNRGQDEGARLRIHLELIGRAAVRPLARLDLDLDGRDLEPDDIGEDRTLRNFGDALRSHNAGTEHLADSSVSG